MKQTYVKHYYWHTAALAVAWHVIFFGFLSFPLRSTELLGQFAWQLYVILLSFLGTALIMVYFLSLVDGKRPRQRKSWLLINSLLICLPLYFLWWNYIQ